MWKQLKNRTKAQYYPPFREHIDEHIKYMSISAGTMAALVSGEPPNLQSNGFRVDGTAFPRFRLMLKVQTLTIESIEGVL